jgi:hypothetical protein
MQPTSHRKLALNGKPKSHTLSSWPIWRLVGYITAHIHSQEDWFVADIDSKRLSVENKLIRTFSVIRE